MHGAILVAGGKGRRMKNKVEDKLLHPILDTNAFRLCCEAFLISKEITSLVVAYRDEEQKQALLAELEIVQQGVKSSVSPIMIRGGEERKDSVLNSLRALPDECKFVQVHDCARPMIRSASISMITEAVEKNGAVVACRPVQDTVRECESHHAASKEPQSTKTLDRTRLWLMETPQAARKDWLIQGFQEANQKGIFITDEIAALELINKRTTFLQLDYPNPKITKVDDLNLVEYLLQK